MLDTTKIQYVVTISAEPDTVLCKNYKAQLYGQSFGQLSWVSRHEGQQVWDFILTE
jgi:hypothetical protein